MMVATKTPTKQRQSAVFVCRETTTYLRTGTKPGTVEVSLERCEPRLTTCLVGTQPYRALCIGKAEIDPMYREFVYVLKAGPYYKIGRTAYIEQRTAQIALQMPFPVELFKVINTDNAAGLEGLLHLLCYSDRVNGEWFKLSSENALKLWIFPPSFSREEMQTEGYDLWGMWRALNEDADANSTYSAQEE